VKIILDLIQCSDADAKILWNKYYAYVQKNGQYGTAVELKTENLQNEKILSL
jgi:hypothetical protein